MSALVQEAVWRRTELDIEAANIVTATRMKATPLTDEPVKNAPSIAPPP